MTLHRIASALLALALAACAEPVASRSAGTTFPGRASRTDQAEMYDAPALALGLRPLRDVTLAPGEREIRLWPSVGPVIPEVLIRVVDRRGAATAEMYAYWKDGPVHQDSAFATFETELREKSACGPIRHAGGFGYCALAAASAERARALVAYLDSIHAWSAADEDPTEAERAAGRTMVQLDGSMLVVEVRRGDRYDGAAYFMRHMTPGSVSRQLFDLHGRF